MTIWQRTAKTIGTRFPSRVRQVFLVQILLLFVISTLLYFGFPGTREWRRQAEENQVQTIMRGWDGLAWYVWLAAAPGMLWLIRSCPLERGRIAARLGWIAVGSVGLYLAVTHLRYLLRLLPGYWWGAQPHPMLNFEAYAYNTFALLPLDFLTYCGFFAVSFSVNYAFKHRQYTEAAIQLELHTVQLQEKLTRAELAALRGQLHPHFLFNSFNALATLVRQRKNEQAVEIIAQLSALLRLAIDRSGLQEIPLRQEVDFIRRYLDIEQVRFGEKLRVDFVLEETSMDALVPNIVLQPLVENAIKHGISRRTTPGTVRVATARRGDRLHVEIADDGPDGPSPGCTAPQPAPKSGIGLTNTRAQLDVLYGADYRLEVDKQLSGGTVVILNLPWRPAPAA